MIFHLEDFAETETNRNRRVQCPVNKMDGGDHLIVLEGLIVNNAFAVVSNTEHNLAWMDIRLRCLLTWLSRVTLVSLAYYVVIDYSFFISCH